MGLEEGGPEGMVAKSHFGPYREVGSRGSLDTCSGDSESSR